MRIFKELFPLSFMLLSMICARPSLGESMSRQKDMELQSFSLSCTFSMTQSWFYVDQDMELQNQFVQYHADDIDMLLTPEQSEETLLESDHRWNLLQGNSIALSPNLNNFRVKLKKKILNDEPHLTVDFLVVHRNLKHNLLSRVSYPVAGRQETIPVHLEHVFGPERLSVGPAQMSSDDMKEGSVFSDRNPAVTLSGECQVTVIHDHSKNT